MSMVTPSTSSAAVRSSLTMHAAPVPNPNNVVVHAQPIGSVRLTYTTSSGKTYPILKPLTAEQEVRLDRLFRVLNSQNHPDFRFNVTKLLSERADGTTDSNYHNNSPAILELRVLIQEIYGDQHVSWNQYPDGHRANASAAPSFSLTSERMKTLQFGETQVNQVLLLKNTAEHPLQSKIAYLKRDRAARKLLTLSRELTDQAIGVAQQQPMTSRAKKLLQAQERLEDTSLDAILAFEAAHKLEAGAGRDDVQAKQAAAKAWIESHPVPTLTMSERWDLKQWSNNVNQTEETHFAEDLARLGCQNRQEYGALGVDERAEGPAFFYNSLADAAARNNEAEIGRIVEGPLFKLAFPDLHQDDRVPVQQALIGRAGRLGQALNAAGDLNANGLNNEQLVSTFDGILNRSLA